MKDFRQVKTWDKAHRLALRVYEVTRTFPESERFELVRQMKRCATSIPANIAEGCGKDTHADLAKFLLISMGSSSEVHYFFILSQDLGFLPADEAVRLQEMVEEVKRMLAAFIRSVRAKGPTNISTVSEDASEYNINADEW